MKYFFDTEFHEYKKKHLLSKPVDTIELISIGIVSESGKEYYAICKDFDLYAAWNSFQIKSEKRDTGMTKVEVKEYWLRENVLRPIFNELLLKAKAKQYRLNQICIAYQVDDTFKYSNFKSLIRKYGKSKAQIAKEIKELVYNKSFKDNEGTPIIHDNNWLNGKPEFYAYYADYDWIVFCWLFGRMIDLPDGFPMYCKDLKQTLDEKAESLTSFELSKLAHSDMVKHNVYSTYDTGVLNCSKSDLLKHALLYPKQTNEHNALDDAKWNLNLYKFIKSL